MTGNIAAHTLNGRIPAGGGDDDFGIEFDDLARGDEESHRLAGSRCGGEVCFVRRVEAVAVEPVKGGFCHMFDFIRQRECMFWMRDSFCGDLIALCGQGFGELLKYIGGAIDGFTQILHWHAGQIRVAFVP